MPPEKGASPFLSEIDFLRTLSLDELKERKNRHEQRQREINEQAGRLVSPQNDITKKRTELEVFSGGAGIQFITLFPSSLR